MANKSAINQSDATRPRTYRTVRVSELWTKEKKYFRTANNLIYCVADSLFIFPSKQVEFLSGSSFIKEPRQRDVYILII